MAVLGDQLTILDIRQRFTGTMLSRVVMTMARNDAIVSHMRFVESQTPQEYEFDFQTSLPRGTWVHAGEGTLPEVAGVDKMVERPGILEMRNRIDDKTLRQAGDSGMEMMYREDMFFMQAMSQAGGNTAYYGSKATDEAQFDGLTAFLGDAGRPNVWNAGATGTGGRTSIYMLDWGLNGVTMFYPPGSDFGIEMQRLPYQTIVDTDGTEMEVHRTRFMLSWGMAVHDHKCVARYAGIRTSVATAQMQPATSTGHFNYEVLIDAASFLRNPGMTRCYVNRAMEATILKSAAIKDNVEHTQMDPFGRPFRNIYGMQFFTDDAIISTEDAL